MSSPDRMIKKYALQGAKGLAISILGLPAAYALIATGTMNVNATIVPVCTFSADNLNFGTYDPTHVSPTDATTTITVKCTRGTPYSITLNGGSGGSVMDRRMAAGEGTLQYNLYTDNTHTQVWGDGTLGQALSGVGVGINMGATHTVYGRITPLQDSPTGTYQDIVTITVTY